MILHHSIWIVDIPIYFSLRIFGRLLDYSINMFSFGMCGRWNKAQRDSRNHKGVWEGAACHLDHLLEPFGQDTQAGGFVLADRKQKWRDFEPAPFGLRPSRRRACSLILLNCLMCVLFFCFDFLCVWDCVVLYIESLLAHRGDAATELKTLMSAHFRSFWTLRAWAINEGTQLFALTEKASFVRVLLMAP